MLTLVSGFLFSFVKLVLSLATTKRMTRTGGSGQATDRWILVAAAFAVVVTHGLVCFLSFVVTQRIIRHPKTIGPYCFGGREIKSDAYFFVLPKRLLIAFRITPKTAKIARTAIMPKTILDIPTSREWARTPNFMSLLVPYQAFN